MDELLDGYLSDEHGFLPGHVIQKLPAEYRIWEDVCSALTELYYEGTEETFRNMPVLDTTGLKSEHLQRATTILGHFAQAWWRNRKVIEELPDSIRLPWLQLSKRLGRCGPFLSYADLMLTNFSFKDPNAKDLYALENLQMSIRAFHNSSEDVFLMAITEMHARAQPIIGASKRLLHACQINDQKSMIQEIRLIIQCILQIRASFHKISANQYNPNYCPPVEWSLSIARWYVPADSAIAGGVSGLSSPLFHLMDKIIGRRSHQSYFGQEKQRYHSLHPVKWQRFLEDYPWEIISESIQSSNVYVKRAWNALLDVYSGEHSLLDSHKAKVFGYIKIAALVGRSQFTSGHRVDVKKQEWHKLTNNLHLSQYERDGVRWFSTYIKSREKIAASDEVREIILPVNLEGKPGDRVLVKIGDHPPRKYSISWVDRAGTHLTIGRIANGLYSPLLNDPNDQPLSINVKLSIAPDFHLTESDRPIVMYAGGTGISPFIGFIKKRKQAKLRNNYLYYSYKSSEMYWYGDLLTKLEQEGWIHLTKIDTSKGKHIYDIPLSFPNDAIHYVCGRAGFAQSIEKSLKKQMGENCFYRLVGEDRWKLDVFYSDQNTTKKVYTWAEISMHDQPHDLWIAIDHKVYDLTEFYSIHPGGQDILRIKAGTDATEDFKRVSLHSGMAEQRMKAYCIGEVEPASNPWLKILHAVMHHKVAAELQREMPGRFGKHYLPEADEYFKYTTVPLINQLLAEVSYPEQPISEIWSWFKKIRFIALEKLTEHSLPLQSLETEELVSV